MALSPESKMKSPDRVLILRKKEGTKPKDTTGMFDPRLFTGENKLHAVMDTQTCLWSLKYEMGVLPMPLKQKFTGFRALMKHVSDYYAKRNIEIVEVKD